MALLLTPEIMTNFITKTGLLKKWPMVLKKIFARGAFPGKKAKRFLCFLLFAGTVINIRSQEILLSPAELYFDFLTLGGTLERPYLNYRTLSDSAWEKDGPLPRFGVNTGQKKRINEKITYRIYGPELFSSYNTTNPYGQNDSVLWQGKGFNSLLKAGGRLELYGFELTLLPEIGFSQNLSYPLIPPPYSSGEAAQYGYYGIWGIDAPQRFGDKPYYEFSWGDSELRYTWKNLTIGFGTQNIWLGPAKINPIILSNNAPPYPKLDIGLRRQPVTIKDTWYGDIEARAFWGQLQESDFFDADHSNDKNLFTGLTLSYSFPSLLKGLTFGFNRIMISKWNDLDYTSIFTLLVPIFNGSAGYDSRDQRLSLTLDYVFPNAGFNIYFEWGRNDYSPNLMYLKYPFHTQGYTFGARKNFKFRSGLQGELLLELTMLESSRDYEFLWPTTFYAHHIITQGHTNRGQWLGAGIGTGGNSQYLGFTLFYQRGYSNLFIQRQNNDNDYVWFMNMGKTAAEKSPDEDKFKTTFSLGLSNYINLNPRLGFFGELVLSGIMGPRYHNDEYSGNLYIALGLSCLF
jgi:hypothetical protein